MEESDSKVVVFQLEAFVSELLSHDDRCLANFLHTAMDYVIYRNQPIDTHSCLPYLANR